MKLSELKEIIDEDMQYFADAEVVITIASIGTQKIHKELDTTLVDTNGKFYFLTDTQWEGKTKNFGKVELGD